MQARGIVLLAACAVLAACGSTKKSDDDADKNFHKQLVSSCVKSASASGVSMDLSQKLCACTADKVDERYSVAQKAALKEEQLRPIVQECKASIVG